MEEQWFAFYQAREELLKNLVCPVSFQHMNKNNARMTAFLVATTVVLFILTHNIAFIVVLLIDFFIRAFTSLNYSPGSWVSAQILKLFRVPEVKTDKAPMIFSARIGFLFTVARNV